MDELYVDDTRTASSVPFELTDILSKIDRIDRQLCKVSGKKSKKRSNKKKVSNKKLKKLLDMLEMEQEQFKYILQFMAMQQQSQVAIQQPPFASWLSDVFEKILPALAIGFFTTAIRNNQK